MCEFCVQHGEGKKWYLAMENYSQELLEQNKRREYAAEFLNTFAATVPGALGQLDLLSRTPLREAAKPLLTARQKQDHFGQVITMEEVETIINKMEKVIRLPCVCRRVTTGNYNARYCYGLTIDQQLANELDDTFSLEYLSPDEAITSIRKLDKEGLIHSVWTFKTPFIGGICNCDQDCVAYRICHARGHFDVMFRGEWIAEVNNDSCNGCKNCMRQCNYGAIRYSAMNKKVEIDPRACYGCGVCRAACHHDAITLHARSEDALAKNIW